MRGKTIHSANLDVQTIPSVNSMWRAGTNKKGTPFMYKPKNIKNWQKEVQDGFMNSDITDVSRWGYDYLAVTVTFYLKKKANRFSKSDCDNLLKILLDSIFPTVVGYDDSKITEIHCFKIPTEDDVEHIEIQIVGLMEDEIHTEYKYGLFNQNHEEE